mgnify:CR=1 FL=1
MTLKHIQFFILCIFLLSGSKIYSQNTHQSETVSLYWTQFGISITSLGPGLAGNLTLDHNNHLFTLGMHSTSLHGFTRDTWDVSFYYGRGWKKETFHLSAGAGVAIISGKTYSGIFGGEPSEQMESMIAFPLRGEIAWVSNRFIAPVLFGVLNVNTNQPFGGIGIALRLGKMR